jgi:phage tail-like protein
MFGQIVVQLQGNVVQTLALTSDMLTVGRAPDNGLVLPFDLVSMYHAEIRVTAQGAFITDLDSKYGTFVAASKLLASQPYYLLPGIAVQIGPYVLTYKSKTDGGHEAIGEPVSEIAQTLEIEAVPAITRPPRSRYPAPLLQDEARYLRFLPIIFHDGPWFGKFMKIFEAIWEPLEWRQTHIDFYFDARTCPSEVMPLLSQWTGFDLDSRWTEDRQRRVLLEGTQLHRWRGTAYALKRLIELTTDVTAKIEDDQNQAYVFHVRLPGGTPEETQHAIKRLLDVHKPAHSGYTLKVEV